LSTQAPTADPALLDAARRIADEMTIHAIAKSEGWVAFWLADGRPLDHVCYPSRVEAVRAAKWNRDNVIYLETQPDAMGVHEAMACLKYARALHAAGFRIPAPEFEFDASMPFLVTDRAKQVRHLASGGRLHPIGPLRMV
jgi:hypothetical protein